MIECKAQEIYDFGAQIGNLVDFDIKLNNFGGLNLLF